MPAPRRKPTFNVALVSVLADWDYRLVGRLLEAAVDHPTFTRGHTRREVANLRGEIFALEPEGKVCKVEWLPWGERKELRKELDTLIGLLLIHSDPRFDRVVSGPLRLPEGLPPMPSDYERDAWWMREQGNLWQSAYARVNRIYELLPPIPEGLPKLVGKVRWLVREGTFELTRAVQERRWFVYQCAKCQVRYVLAGGYQRHKKGKPVEHRFCCKSHKSTFHSDETNATATGDKEAEQSN